MEQEQFLSLTKSYLNLLSIYLNQKKVDDLTIDDETLSFYLRLSKSHSLLALFFKVVESTKANINKEAYKKLEEHYYAAIRKDAFFIEERKALYAYLNEKEIDYLPLKGIVLKEYYLDPYTREYADNDILFNKGDELIKEFFTKRDYTVEYYKKSNHDVYMKKPFFNFEMHRALFGETGDNEKLVNYFKDYLVNSPIKEGYEHYLNKEQFYIYFTAHSYKHFHVSGCGIRTLVDYYLYLNKEQLDFAYINEELNKLDLLDFSNKFSSLAKKVFNNEELSKEEEEMLLFIASSGTYGTLEHAVSKGIKEKGKFRYFMSRLFPPFSFYKSAYPWAYKCPILIPIAWLARCFRILFKNPKRAVNEIKTINKSKEEKSK